jgi:hypothetical protein
MRSWSILTADGGQIVEALQATERDARAAAQRIADERGAAVELYPVDGPDESEWFEPDNRLS